MKLLASLLMAISLLAYSHAVIADPLPLLPTTNHCGSISSDETWSSSTVHLVTCEVTVNPGVTLTISAGAIIKFNNDQQLSIGGALKVAGSASQPVYFTSYRDDSVGGDTNGDGSSTIPGPGNWLAISFRNTSDPNSIIDHAVIRYGGDLGSGDVNLTGASPRIQNSTIAYSLNAAIIADVNSSPTLVANLYKNNGWNGIDIPGGTVTGDTTWDILDAPYIIGDDVYVGVGSTLTIQPGVAVKFANDKSLFVDGTLKAAGTVNQPVYFTSVKDDSVVGDTNGDGSSSTPSPGNWMGIQFRATSSANSILDHAVIRYSGDLGTADIVLTGASPTIQNSTLAYSLGAAIQADVNSLPTLTNNTYKNNSWNGFRLISGTISANTTWSILDVPYIVGDNVYVGVGGSLTINPGVIVKFDNDKSLTIDGTLKAVGTAAQPIYFTSVKDDTVGGDTNGDGSSSTPNPGNWMGIQFRDNSSDANSIIDHAVIRYGGDLGSGDVGLDNASPIIQYSTITNSVTAGINITNAVPKLVCNNIYNNSMGLTNQTVSTVVSAVNQWWGSPSGPLQKTTNPNGAGNEVSDGVTFTPWLTAQCGSSGGLVLNNHIYMPVTMR